VASGKFPPAAGISGKREILTGGVRLSSRSRICFQGCRAASGSATGTIVRAGICLIEFSRTTATASAGMLDNRYKTVFSGGSRQLVPDPDFP